MISKYPEFCGDMISSFLECGIEVWILTDMPRATGEKIMAENADAFGNLGPESLLCADFAAHGEYCKAKLIEEHGIQMHFDDHMGYLMPANCVRMLVMPDASKPYYDPSFKGKEDWK